MWYKQNIRKKQPRLNCTMEHRHKTAKDGNTMATPSPQLSPPVSFGKINESNMITDGRIFPGPPSLSRATSAVSFLTPLGFRVLADLSPRADGTNKSSLLVLDENHQNSTNNCRALLPAFFGNSPAPTNVLMRRTPSSELYRSMMHPTPSLKRSIFGHSPFQPAAMRSTPVPPPLNRGTSAELWSLATQNGFTPLPSLLGPSPADEEKFDYLVFASSAILNGSGKQALVTTSNENTPMHSYAYTSDAIARMNQPLIETPMILGKERHNFKRKTQFSQMSAMEKIPSKKNVVARTAKSVRDNKELDLHHNSLFKVASGGEIIQVTPEEGELWAIVGNEENMPPRHPFEAWTSPKSAHAFVPPVRHQPQPVTVEPSIYHIDRILRKNKNKASSIADVPTQTNATAVNAAEKNRVCSCKNSKCLKLYCDCFSSSEFCNPNICKCNKCKNNKKNIEDRDQARKFCLSKNKSAFSGDKMTRKEQRDALLLSQPIAPPQPCSCVKSRCLRKYCGCFFLGFFCSEKCGCVLCANIPITKNGTMIEAIV